MTVWIWAARQRLSGLIRRALVERRRTATGHGEAVAVSGEATRSNRCERMDFKEFLLSGPDLSALEIERSRELPRRVEL